MFGSALDVMNGYKWELFNLADDPTQTNDLSAKEPERLCNRCGL